MVEQAWTRGGGFSDTFIAFLDHNDGQYSIRYDMLANNIIIYVGQYMYHQKANHIVVVVLDVVPLCLC